MSTRKANRKDRKRGTRKQSGGGNAWATEVSSVHKELKQKNPAATLKDAMKEASRRRKAHKK